MLRGFKRSAVASGLGVALGATLVSGASAFSTPGAPDGQRTAPAVDGRELVGLRSEFSRTWARPDGARVTRVFEEPVSVKAADGAWRLIDPGLRRDGAAWVNGTAPFDLAIPGSLDDGPVEIEAGGERIGLQLRGADVEAQVDGASATFGDVADGVSAVWTSTAGGVKEQLVLSGSEAVSSFTFDVALSAGLRLVDQPGGGVAAIDADGKVAFTLAAPYAFDDAGERAPATAVRMTSSRGAGGWEVSVVLDRSWLEAPSRTFPVTIDPTVDVSPSADCYLDQHHPDISRCTEEVIGVGDASGFDANGMLRFDVADVVPAEANVMQVRVLAYADELIGTRSAATDAFNVTAAWTNAATWNRRTATDAWTMPGGDIAAAPEDTAPAPVEGQWSHWFITDLFKSWVDGSVANNGIQLRAQSSVTDTGTAFLSSDFPDPDAWPVLEVVYFGRTGSMGDYTIDSHQISGRQSLGVNVAGGNLFLNSSDLQIAGRGLDLSVDRAFNSQTDRLGQVGLSSTLSVGRDVELLQCDRGGSLCFRGPSGFHARFRRNPDGSYVTPPAVNAGLVKETDGSWTMTFHRTGVRYRFFASSDDTFLTDVVDRNNNRIHFDYSSGKLSRITDTQGRVIVVTPNRYGDITEIEDPTGRRWLYGYDSARRLTSVTDPETGQVRYGYDAYGHLEQITDGRNNVTTIDYDADLRVRSVRRRIDGTLTNDLITTYTYAAPGASCVRGDVSQTTVVDPLGRSTVYCWNAQGQVSSARDALGRDTSTTFTPNGDAADYTSFVGTGNAALSSQVYDADNNLRSRTSPAGERESWTAWSAASNPSDPLRRYRTESYVDAQGSDEVYGYDNAGNLTDVKDDVTSPRNQATLTYNADGTLRTATDGNGNTTTFGYDRQGNLTSVDPAGPVLATTYTHDALGRVATTTDGRGETLEFDYDDLDRQTRVQAEDGSWTSYEYDPNDNLIVRDSSTIGQRTTYTYDKVNRRTAEDFPGSPYNTYGYDKAGNLTSLTNLSGTVTYTYDDIRRTRTIVSPRPGGGTDTVTYAYTDPSRTDAFLRRTATLPGSATQVIDTDLSGKVVDVVLRNSASTVLQRRTYDYVVGSDQRALVQLMVDQAGNRTAYDYASTTEDVGRLLSAQTIDSAARPVVSYEYGYDRAGNRTSMTTDLSGSVTHYSFAYNAANQLCWWANVRSSNACASPPVGTIASFAYDAAGNQTTGGHALTWDRYNRLTQIDSNSLGYLSPTNGELTALGSQMLENNLFGLSRIVGGTTTTSIVRNPNTGEPVSQTTGSDKRWYTGDNIGSTIALTDSSGGLARSYSYSPDGANSTSGTGPEAALLYAGGHRVATDPGRGDLYHYGARYYNTAVARWTSLDPLQQYADLTQANRYSYVGGDPVNHIDPAGLAKCEDVLPAGFCKVAKKIGPFSVACAATKVRDWREENPTKQSFPYGEIPSIVWECSPIGFIPNPFG